MLLLDDGLAASGPVPGAGGAGGAGPDLLAVRRTPDGRDVVADAGRRAGHPAAGEGSGPPGRPGGRPERRCHLRPAPTKTGSSTRLTHRASLATSRLPPLTTAAVRPAPSSSLCSRR